MKIQKGFLSVLMLVLIACTLLAGGAYYYAVLHPRFGKTQSTLETINSPTVMHETKLKSLLAIATEMAQDEAKRDWKSLYQFACRDSKNQVSEAEFVKVLANLYSGLESQGFIIKGVVLGQGSMFTPEKEVLLDNGLTSPEEFESLTEAKVTFHRIIDMITPENQTVENGSGVRRTFRFEGDTWCFVTQN